MPFPVCGVYSSSPTALIYFFQSVVLTYLQHLSPFFSVCFDFLCPGDALILWYFIKYLSRKLGTHGGRTQCPLPERWRFKQGYGKSRGVCMLCFPLWLMTFSWTESFMLNSCFFVAQSVMNWWKKSPHCPLCYLLLPNTYNALQKLLC